MTRRLVFVVTLAAIVPAIALGFDSSAATLSPAFLSQRATVAEVTLSPRVGTLMSMPMIGSG